MSTSEKNQDGDMFRFKVRGIQEFLGMSFPKPEALQRGLLYTRNVHWFVVEPDVCVRMLGFLLSCTVAIGADFGPFTKGPGKKVLYISGAGDKAADHHRLNLIYKSLDAEQLARLVASHTIYGRDAEGDAQIDLTTDEGRNIFVRSIPTGTEVLFIDCFSAFSKAESISARQRDELDPWFRKLADQGFTVVIFDVETKKRTMREERRAKNTIYLDYDDTAPTQFGGGCMLRRNRIDDADSMPKCVSFWYTEFDGKLEYGFSVPDDEDLDAPRLTKRLERQIKVEKMLRAGISQKLIAKGLKVHAATICRDTNEIEIRAAKVKKAKAKSFGPQLDSGSKVGEQ